MEKILYSLGITRCYEGFRLLMFAVDFASDSNKIVLKEVYAAAALRFGCSWDSVERNIRTAIKCAWRTNPELLRQIAGRKLSAPPTAAKFIDMLIHRQQ